MVILDKTNFDSEVNNSKYAIIDFFAEWCGPCKMQGPVLEQLSTKYQDIKWCKVDIDENASLAAKFDVRSIPTVVFLKDGKELFRYVGYRPLADVEGYVNKLLANN